MLQIIFNNVLSIVVVVLVFGGLIFFHELGHFLVARAFSMGVKTFSLGFGRPIASITRGKTKYQVAVVPLGGYVALVGEGKTDEIPEPFTPEESFSLRPAWQRFFVILAGSAANLLLAWFICWGLLYAKGKIELPPIIGDVVAESPAADASLQAGDAIFSIDGISITHWEQIPKAVFMSQGSPMQVVILRQGEPAPLTLTVTPRENEIVDGKGKKHTMWFMGIQSTQPVHRELTFLQAAGEGYSKAKDMAMDTVMALSGLVKKKVALDSMVGPVGIAQIISEQTAHGAVSVLLIAALISVNLGLLNLLPIPVLDGGHLFFITLEMIFRRPVPQAVQEKAMLAGMFLLLSLMLFATFNDVVRIAG